MRTTSTPACCAAASSTRLSAALIGMSLILAAVSADSSIVAISAGPPGAPRAGRRPSDRAQASQPGARLGAHVGRRGAAVGGAAFDRALHAEPAEGVLGDARLDALHLVQRQLLEHDATLRGERHDAAGDVMRFAERNLESLHEPVREI